MKFTINNAVLSTYPQTSIGMIVASFDNSKQSPVVEKLKTELPALTKKLGITKDHPHIAGWREIYKTFGVNPKDYRSSVEALVRRVTDNKIWNISPAVDLYNCISTLSVLPMGGYDLNKIKGHDIEIRFARAGETFRPLGKDVDIPLSPAHIVYALDNTVICWLWNYKDAAISSIDQTSTREIFFIDAAKLPVSCSMKQATDLLADSIRACGGIVHQQDIITAESPTVQITDDFSKSSDTAVSYEDLLKKIAALPALTAPTNTKNPTLPEAHVVSPSQEHEIRLEKIKQMRAENINPWPESRPVTCTTQAALDAFQKDQTSTDSYMLAGRLMIKRDHGKTFFGVIQDRGGSIQVYIKKDDIGDLAFEQFKKYVDIGDILWVKGPLFITKMGETTVKVEALELLSKCLHPLPEKFHGLTDIEQRYRQRYLDLISNPESREKFKKRSYIIQAIRDFLTDKDFLEVETPMLHPIPGGATARPFITHHNAYDMDLYMRIAPELYLKRLVVGGFERVFEINRNFRNEGVSTKHNPEFTMLEFYMAHGDYKTGMELVEQLIQNAVLKNFKSLELPFHGKQLNFAAPFTRLSVKDSLVRIGGLTADQISEKNIDTLMQEKKVTLHKGASHGEKLFALFEESVEAKIVQPTFITDYPIEVSPLAKRDEQNKNIAARFELFIAGMECANSFSELNDPIDQADRFKGQVLAREGGNQEAHHYDADYIKALEYGLPPTVGVGIGIDRLVMLLTDTNSIKDVILFPTLKKIHE